MQQRPFGPNLKTSAVGFGGGAISGEGGGYGFGNVDDAQAARVLQYAYERGVTLFDTAPIYGFGMSEKRMGAHLARHKDVRKNIVLVSKLGVTWDAGNTNVRVDNSPETLTRQLHQSLKDLQTDYLDLYMIHWPDANTPVESTMEALLKHKEQGLIKAIGACNFDAPLLARAKAVGPVDVIQNHFNAIDETVKVSLFPAITKDKTGFMSYGTLAKGILAGTVTKERIYDATDFRARGTRVQDQLRATENFVTRFLEMAKTKNVAPTQLAVAWVLSHSEVSVALCGSKSTEQMQLAIDGANVTLTPTEKQNLDALAHEATPYFQKVNK